VPVGSLDAVGNALPCGARPTRWRRAQPRWPDRRQRHAERAGLPVRALAEV